jgi:NCAIR mutase (PurE)-related protein
VTDFTLDWERTQRTGFPEAIYCAGKHPDQLAAILATAQGAGRRLLLTRLDQASFGALPAEAAEALDYDPPSRTAILGGAETAREQNGIVIVTAGTTDLPVAREAHRTLLFHGVDASVIPDIGVAGLWRLIERLEQLRAARVVIAVAGMEAALFSVLAGLVPAPVIAVPSSIGYGVAAGGTAALHAALASCAPGIVTVNIDNGFGAAVAALKIIGATAPERAMPSR